MHIYIRNTSFTVISKNKNKIRNSSFTVIFNKQKTNQKQLLYCHGSSKRAVVDCLLQKTVKELLTLAESLNQSAPLSEHVEMLQCVAVLRIVLRIATATAPLLSQLLRTATALLLELQHTATHCNTLQHTATHCNTLQHLKLLYCHAVTAVADCNTSFTGAATHCNTLQHTATHCNTLQNLKFTVTLSQRIATPPSLSQLQ